MTIAPATQHRMILAAPRPAMDPSDAAAHWIERHGDVVRGLPHICGYVQDRPLASWSDRTGYIVCTESWWPSRETEAEAFGSDHYRDVVGVDEARFMDRETSWTSVVADVEILRDGPRGALRVLAFGAPTVTAGEVPGTGLAEILHLRRVPPDGTVPEVLSVWFDDPAEADALAEALGGLAFVTRPTVIIKPPGW